MVSTSQRAALFLSLMLGCIGGVNDARDERVGDAHGENDEASDEGDSGDGDSTSDEDTADGDESPGDGDTSTGDGDTSTGDGDTSTGDGDTSTGDGDTSTGDGDTSTGDGDTSTGDGDTGDGDTSTGDGDGGELVWRTANLTNYESYPDPGSEECIAFNGCTWAGYFAGLDGQQPLEWVMANNIAAVHLDDFETYKYKTLRLRDGWNEIDVVVYDACSDSDCDGCCSANSAETGFLIDIEKYTAERFGFWHGIVEWACVDC